MCLIEAPADLTAQEKGGDNREHPTQYEGAAKNMSLPPTLARQKSKSNIYLANCTQPKDHDEADLCQQIRMAEAADLAAQVAWNQFVVSVFGLAGLIFTVWYTGKAAWAASRSAIAAESALSKLERAFVTLQNIEGNVQGRGQPDAKLRVILKWYNGGRSPTRNMLYQASFVAFRTSGIPADFPYPDAADVENVRFVLGPGASATTTPIEIPLDVVRTRDCYVWGWVEYDDVFEDTPRHRTEFCTRVELAETKEFIRVSFHNTAQHNGMDEECPQQRWRTRKGGAFIRRIVLTKTPPQI